ncbi:hypothetical protein F1188_16100 [Roseospira marina]|uniref:Uncharacterized protein n=1 Tax=Roseospira marina TaxID=140057 RepID=A0A5M6I8A8_9PROT|nr:hypothetical protein [Roseospira marina]KAA5604382.1 hypothetical protein F1188_16100 [Roseospira marina]MBB4315429.1 hypothetical protein [Roseospira marina]MBB5088425.1 hypothetical protein [Roseospira marina]
MSRVSKAAMMTLIFSGLFGTSAHADPQQAREYQARCFLFYTIMEQRAMDRDLQEKIVIYGDRKQYMKIVYPHLFDIGNDRMREIREELVVEIFSRDEDTPERERDLNQVQVDFMTSACGSLY